MVIMLYLGITKQKLSCFLVLNTIKNGATNKTFWKNNQKVLFSMPKFRHIYVNLNFLQKSLVISNVLCYNMCYSNSNEVCLFGFSYNIITIMLPTVVHNRQLELLICCSFVRPFCFISVCLYQMQTLDVCLILQKNVVNIYRQKGETK